MITREELRDMILEKEDISKIDYSHLRDLSFLFQNCEELIELPHMDVSNVENMEGMFQYCINFNGNINDWDVSNVENMNSMFCGCTDFDQPLDRWNTSKVKDMGSMFNRAHSFNQNINEWDVSNVETMDHMFYYANMFNQPLDKWNVGRAMDMHSMFWKDEGFWREFVKDEEDEVEHGSARADRKAETFQSFLQDLSTWEIHPEATISNLFDTSVSFLHNFGTERTMEILLNIGAMDPFAVKAARVSKERTEYLCEKIQNHILWPNRKEGTV